jgi:hypothetical protein
VAVSVLNALDRGLEAGELTAEPAELVRVGDHLGACQVCLEVVVLRGDLGELRVEIGHGTRGGSSVVAASDRFGRRTGVSP